MEGQRASSVRVVLLVVGLAHLASFVLGSVLLLSDELQELASVELLAAGLTHLASFVPKSVLLPWGELQELLYLVEIVGPAHVPLEPSDYR